MSFTEIDPAFRLPDEVWERVKSAIPPERPKPKGGRPRMNDRQVLDAIFYIMRTGCQWKALPRCLGASSTVHDRYQEWVEQGVFLAMWELGLKAYAQEVGIDWEWMAMDGAMVKAPLGGNETGANPTDRAKSGTKRSVLTDGNGVPIGVAIAAANRHDMKLTQATLESQPIVPTDLGPENLGTFVWTRDMTTMKSGKSSRLGAMLSTFRREMKVNGLFMIFPTIEHGVG
jgi:putative transposase